MELADIETSLIAAAKELRDEDEPDVFGPAYRSLLGSSDHEAVLLSALPLRSGIAAEQVFYARLVAQLQNLSSKRRLDEVAVLLEGADNPKALRWLLVAIREARSAAALVWLLELAKHASATVRFSVPDALSACASGLEDVVDSLLELSRDEDEDVRWSAVYELCAWEQEATDERLSARLEEVTTNDPSAAVRRAAQGLAPDVED